MRLPLFIAKRYFFSTRKKTFINIISIISMNVVAIITAALIIVLSVFNGLEDLLRNLNNAFDPEIKIEAKKGKTFEITPSFMQTIKQTEGVDIITEVMEDYAYVRYREANQVVTIKAVTENFLSQHRIDAAIVRGKLQLKNRSTYYALVGLGVERTLSGNTFENMYPLRIYYIKDVNRGTIDPTKLYSQRSIMPGAVFSIVQNFDDNYIIVPMEFAQDLFQNGNKRTSLEIKVKEGYDLQKVESELKAAIGQDYYVLSHEEQHKDLYKLLKMEKLFAFISAIVLLAVGSINIYFTLMMLALDKKRDISIISAMGVPLPTIRNIFLLEGVFIAFAGAAAGLIIGGTLCWLQDHYSLISMGMQSAVIDGYPVKLVMSDFIYVLVAMFCITFLISYRPATLATRFASVQNL